MSLNVKSAVRRASGLFMAAAIVFSAAGCNSGTEESEAEDNYASKLFDNSYVHTIDVEISEEDWTDLKENPLNKTKYEVNVVIDGETINSVSFATKGNTSLSSVASDADSDRYSFKINFGKYVAEQTYYGLDKLNLNNLYADATYMKDYICYEIFKAAGVASPLTSYVFLTVNGEDFGLYLAIEEIGDSYLSRTTDGEGELYKPETDELGNMGGGGQMMELPEGMEFPEGMELPGGMEMPVGIEPSEGMEMPEGMELPEGMEMPEGAELPEGMEMPEGAELPEGMEMPEGAEPSEGMQSSENTGDRERWDMRNAMGGMDMFGSSSSGASLKYSDDEISSYSDIFDNAVTDVDEEDQKRVIAALKQLASGENLEECLDVESVIRYFVAHNFVLNYDSYTGNMLHNYYLYENEGRLSMLPWDYNLSFGAFSGSSRSQDDITSILNYAIDTPLSGAEEEDRPMWSFIVENEEYLELYHKYFSELITDYFDSGEFAAEIDRVYEMLLPYVEKDPSAFYTAEEFTKAYETLREFCLLRAESISKQLSGALASVTADQEQEAMVDAGELQISDMGSQNMGGRNMGDWDMDGNGMGGRNMRDWNMDGNGTGGQDMGDWNMDGNGTGGQDMGDWDMDGNGMGGRNMGDWDMDGNGMGGQDMGDWNADGMQEPVQD